MSRSQSLSSLSVSSGSQGSSPPQSPIYPTTPPPGSNHPYVHHSSKELSLMRIPALTSATQLTRPPSFPAPPTGHDLMLMFPSPPPPPVEYTGTSVWFGREEREFFKEGNCGVGIGRELGSTGERRSRSLSEEEAHMHMLSPPSHSPQPQPQPHSNQPQHSQPSPTLQQQPPPQHLHGTRRRAGKYTKRVFVSHPPVYPPHGPGAFLPSEMPPPQPPTGYSYPQVTPQPQAQQVQAWGM